MRQYSLKSKMVSSALALVMVLGIINIPAVNVKADGDPVEVSTWSQLKSEIEGLSDNAEASYKLTAELKPNYTFDYQINISGGRKVTIDLNGYDIVRQKGGASNTNAGSFFVIDGESETQISRLTIVDDSDDPGSLTGSSKNMSSPVMVDSYGEFYLEGGKISGNSCRTSGGAVSVFGGTFVMNGGSITRNTAYASDMSQFNAGGGRGGGVYVTDENSTETYGTFIMNGGVIYANGYTTTISNINNDAPSCTNQGGAVYIDKGCYFELNGDGKIGVSGSEATDTYGLGCNYAQKFDAKGGSVYVGGTFVMNSGSVQFGEGSALGGVYVANGADFTMKGGTVNSNAGGNVYIDNGGSFVLEDGTIARVESGNGSGVYVNGTSEGAHGVFTMNGGKISGNNSYKGGGVHINDYAVFTMNDGEITGNSSTESDYGVEGGGVYVGPHAAFNMAGGSITQNKAKNYGGGVYVDQYGCFNLSCGQITDNSIEVNVEENRVHGGGIYLALDGNLNLSNNGVINITGNKHSTTGGDLAEDNVFVDITNNDYENTGSIKPIRISEKVAEGSKIGVGFNGSLYRIFLTSGYEDNYGYAPFDDLFVRDQTKPYYMRFESYDGKKEVLGFKHDNHLLFFDNTLDDTLAVSCRQETNNYYTACEMTGTLTIKVNNPYYTGNPVKASLEVTGDFADLTGIEVDENDIKYYLSNNTSTPLDGAPVDEGNYVAKYTATIEGSNYKLSTQFTVGKCKVTFNNNNHGTAPGALEVVCGQTISEPDKPTATGYFFGGWYTDPECSDANAYDFTQPVTESFTLYAKWTKCLHSDCEPTYSWSGNNICTGSYKCNICGSSSSKTVTATGSKTKDPTCTENGERTYVAKFNAVPYTDQYMVVDNIPALGHIWGAAEYEWSDDGSSCTASKTCSRDVSHVETESGEISSVVTKEPSVTEEGSRLCTATFTKEGFETQTKEVAIPKLGVFDVTFDLQGVEADAVASQQIVEGQKAEKPVDPSSDEYVFLGWYKDCECTEEWDFDTDTITGATTIYAKWTHTHEDGTVFTVWGQTDKMPAKPGNYCFIKDVMVSDPVFLAEGTWNYCLHGSTVKCHRVYNDGDLGGQNQHFINVSTGNSTLNIYDCQDGSGKITMDWGSGIYIGSGSVVNLYSGKIADCRKRIQSVGFGVEIYRGTFNMYGGSIEGGDNSGVYLSYQATFNMHGGTITNNEAYLGGGVRISGGSIFNISGGTITKNQMSETGMKRLGHGVYIDSGTMNIVAAPGKDTTSKIYIYENSRWGWHCNIDVKTGKLNVLAKVDEDSRIGIWHHDSPTPSNPEIVLTNGFKDNATITQIFPDKHYRATGDYSDDYNYLPKINDSGELTLHLCYDVEFVPGEGTGEPVTKTLFAGTNVYPEFMFKAPLGYGFVRWAKIGNASGIPGTEFEVNRDYKGVTAIGAVYEELPDINFTVDFGEGHEDLVSSYYGSYPVDGSKITLTVPAGTTLHDAMYGIPIKFNDIQDNGEWFYGLFEVGAFGLKPAKQYASKAEYDQELEDSKNVPITDGTTIYALWFTPVENLVLTVKAPDCGTVVNYDETATEYPYQDVVPEIDISGDAVLTSTVWLAEDYKTAGSQYYFDGRLTGDNTYFANFYLEAKFGYTFVFERYITDFLTVKGATLSVADTGMVNEQNMGGLFSVTISHQPGEKAVENEVDATCTETGKYDEVVRCTGCKTVISSEPKTTAALGHDWSAYVVTTPAEVGKKGVETSTCSRCKQMQTRDIPALEPTATPTAAPTSEPTAVPTAVPTAAADVSVKLNKSSVNIVCGKSATLRATVTGSTDKVTWKSSDSKVAAVDANGKVTAKMAGTVTITATVAGKNAECKVTVLYKDVTNTKDFWFAPTNYLTAAGVVKGYDKQTKFKPANVCTRAQMVTFIWRLAGQPEPKVKTCKFKDVKAKDYFYKACMWGNEKHIVEGYKDGTFGPQIVCARRHAVTFLWRLAGKPNPKDAKNKFKDVKKSDYFYTATLWASEKGILAGYSDGTFRPNGNCLRRQMVTFLYKYDKFINGKG